MSQWNSLKTNTFSIVMSLTQQSESGCLTDEQTEAQRGKSIRAKPAGAAWSRAASPGQPCLLLRRPRTAILDGSDSGGEEVSRTLARVSLTSIWSPGPSSSQGCPALRRDSSLLRLGRGSWRPVGGTPRVQCKVSLGRELCNPPPLLPCLLLPAWHGFEQI